MNSRNIRLPGIATASTAPSTSGAITVAHEKRGE
jgi:hypothetical protein